MTGRPVIGVILAIIVEARHWVRLRWDFDDDACGRAWQISCLAIALAAVLVWFDGTRYTALPDLLSWLPPLLVPMQFVQTYGMRDDLPMSIFSFLARYRRERNRRLGLIEETTKFNFGNVLFASTMVAATVGSRADSPFFLPGLVVLTGWILLAAGRSSPFALIPVIALAGLMAIAGKIGLERAEEWLGRTSSSYRSGFDPNFSPTRIGASGPVELSPEIVWRLRTDGKTPPPRLLRTATFNTFLGTSWQNQRVAATDFKDVDSLAIGEASYEILQPTELAKNIPSLPSFKLRGAARNESPLPLPGDVAGTCDFDLDGMERNSFGTVRVAPKHSVIDGTVFWKGGTNPEIPPIVAEDSTKSEDLRIPIAEASEPGPAAAEGDAPPPMKRTGGAIHAAVVKLGLKEAPTLEEKLNRMRMWFHTEFRYTLNLTIKLPPAERRTSEPTVLTRFLTEVRAGHCEYFATAATLMLRDAGIPARFAKGYAVMERDPKSGEYIIRGTHGHAWCRVWDEVAGKWIDFDPTPPNWLAAATPQPTLLQRFNDGLQRLREDFFIWRNRPANRLAVSVVMIGIGVALAAFIIKRLWRSRRRIASGGNVYHHDGPVIRTPLHDLEYQARKRLGHRPPGQTFAQWLAPALPDSASLEEAIRLHQQLRFDPEPPPQGTRERLTELAKQLDAALKRK